MEEIKTNNLNKISRNVNIIKHITVPSSDSADSIDNLELKEGMDVTLEKWTFRKLNRAIKKGKIKVDKEFQRDEIYRIPQKSSIIDSAMAGKCIPPLYAFEDKEDNRYVLSIIDGQQRLSAIRDFMNSRYELEIPYGKFSILNGYTFEMIEKINKDLAEQIGDLTLDINVIRNINKEEAQEYFGLINTSSVPLSPGEKLWSVHDPVKSILKEIVNNAYFKITNIRRTRKHEYVIATRLLWNAMFNNPSRHEFVGNEIKTFLNYFNTTNDIALLEHGRDKVIKLLHAYSMIVENCQYSPRSQGDLYSTLCFLSVLEQKKDELNITLDDLTLFINWLFKGINKQIYPFRLREQFDVLSHSRVTSRGHTSPKEFVIMMEFLFNEERQAWTKLE